MPGTGSIASGEDMPGAAPRLISTTCDICSKIEDVLSRVLDSSHPEAEDRLDLSNISRNECANAMIRLNHGKLDTATT